MIKWFHVGLSVLIFAGIWTGAIIDCQYDTKVDVDLGVATSELSVASNAAWALPFALVLWAPCEALLIVAHWVIHRKRANAAR